jgi:aryl-alcohol dehydrogenase-like predicted oxidoreductase
MLPYCNFNGVGIIPWGPIAAGQLCRPVGEASTRSDSAKGGPWEVKYSDADKAIVGRVEEVAKKHGKTMAQVALAWAQTKCSSPIVGMSSIKRVEDNILGEYKLTEEEIKYLEEP